MKDKLKILFIPTLLTHVGLVVVYTFLHWILFIKLELLGLKEGVTSFGIPIVLTGITAWILLRPRFKILHLETKRGNLRDFYSFILWMVLTVPLIIAQKYIVTASGQLTELKSIDEITRTEPTKFYTLKDYYLDKKAIGIHSAFDVSGKHNESFICIFMLLYQFSKKKQTQQNPNVLPGWELNTRRRLAIDSISLKKKEDTRTSLKEANETLIERTYLNLLTWTK